MIVHGSIPAVAKAAFIGTESSPWSVETCKRIEPEASRGILFDQGFDHPLPGESRKSKSAFVSRPCPARRTTPPITAS